MTIGKRIWDKNGKPIFSETDFTMRVLGVVQIRLGNRTGTWTVPTPLAKPGVQAMVQPLPGAYGAWLPNQGGTRASIPTVIVGDGQLILRGPSRSTYLANVDVVMVGTQ